MDTATQVAAATKLATLFDAEPIRDMDGEISTFCPGFEVGALRVWISDRGVVARNAHRVTRVPVGLTYRQIADWIRAWESLHVEIPDGEIIVSRQRVPRWSRGKVAGWDTRETIRHESATLTDDQIAYLRDVAARELAAYPIGGRIVFRDGAPVDVHGNI